MTHKPLAKHSLWPEAGQADLCVLPRDPLIEPDEGPSWTACPSLPNPVQSPVHKSFTHWETLVIEHLHNTRNAYPPQ